MKTKTVKIGFNALGFQAAWWLSVIGVMLNKPWLGPVAMGLFLVQHFAVNNIRRSEIYLLATAAVVGLMADSLKAGSGLITYGGALLPFTAPLWIVGMWVGFAATINHSLGWLRGRLFLSAITGAVFGPLAYLTGRKLDVLEFNLPALNTVLILALIWGIAVPVLYWLLKKFREFDHG